MAEKKRKRGRPVDHEWREVKRRRKRADEILHEMLTLPNERPEPKEVEEVIEFIKFMMENHATLRGKYKELWLDKESWRGEVSRMTEKLKGKWRAEG